MKVTSDSAIAKHSKVLDTMQTFIILTEDWQHKLKLLLLCHSLLLNFPLNKFYFALRIKF